MLSVDIEVERETGYGAKADAPMTLEAISKIGALSNIVFDPAFVIKRLKVRLVFYI